MKAHALLLILISLAAPLAMAADLDLGTEDVAAESDKAMAETKSVKENLAKERDQAATAEKAASHLHENVAQKKQSAVEEMNRSQNEIQDLTAEQTKLKQETEKMNVEIVTSSKTLEENRAKIQKAKLELQAVKQLHDETNKKLLDIAAETDKTALEIKDLDHAKVQEAANFQQLKEDEKVSAEKLAKMKEEQMQKQAQAALAVSNAVSPANVAPDAPSAPFGASAPVTTAKTEAPQTAEIQRTLSSMAPPAVDSGAELKLKKDCKIYDRTTKDPQVIGVKYNGTSIVKTDEYKYWIGISLAPGQKGYMAKTCF